MKTVDGHEIKIGDTLCNDSGEQFIVTELFPAESDQKVVVIPQFLIESMVASGAGGHHHEIDVECEYEAEPTVIKASRLFLNAPTQRIDEAIADKKAELATICTKIGLARVELTNSTNEYNEALRKMRVTAETAQKELESIRASLQAAFNIFR